MSHDYHERLPGYNPDQILHDGCEECEARGAHVERAIANLDHKRFGRAWIRAADQLASEPPSGDRGGSRPEAEMPLLAALWAIQVQLQRRGVPLGAIPGEDVRADMGIR